jgi:endonuclease G
MRFAPHVSVLGLVLLVGFGYLRHHHARPEAEPTASAPISAPGTLSYPTAGTAPAATGALDAPACVAQLPHGRAPVFANPAVTARAVPLCYPSFAVFFSPLARTPLWSAEYLDPARVQAARTLKRVNVFHPDAHLASGDRAELADYVRSGYDRGHLSPSGDQPTAATQADSFSLANMAPQNPGLNRGPWEQLESAVRDRAQRSPLYVITGVRFVGATIQTLKGRVGIPTTFYKLVYDPATQEATVFEAMNQEGGQPQPETVAAFEQAAGVSFGLGPVRPLTLAPSRSRGYANRASED